MPSHRKHCVGLSIRQLQERLFPPLESGKGTYCIFHVHISGVNSKQEVELSIPDVEEFYSSTRLFRLLNILLELLEMRQIKVLLVQGP